MSSTEINAQVLVLLLLLLLRCSSAATTTATQVLVLPRLGTDFTADEEGCPRSATGEKAISYRWQRNPLELESNYWIWPKNELSKCEDLIYKSYLEENQC